MQVSRAIHVTSQAKAHKHITNQSKRYETRGNLMVWFFCEIIEWFSVEAGLIVLMCGNLKSHGSIGENLNMV